MPSAILSATSAFAAVRISVDDEGYARQEKSASMLNSVPLACVAAAEAAVISEYEANVAALEREVANSPWSWI